MFKRLQPDFQLGIVLIYGCCAVTLVSCFAAYRFMTGSIPGGLLDLGLVISIASMVLYGWRSGKVELAGKFLVLFNIIGTVLSTILLGDTGLYWVFVSISVNFFLTRSTWFATASNVLMLLAVILLSQGFTNQVTLWTFLSTGSMLTLLSAIVSRQNRLQQQRLQHLSINRSADRCLQPAQYGAGTAALGRGIQALRRKHVPDTLRSRPFQGHQ